jgi:hypothetical protein
MDQKQYLQNEYGAKGIDVFKVIAFFLLEQLK